METHITIETYNVGLEYLKSRLMLSVLPLNAVAVQFFSRTENTLSGFASTVIAPVTSMLCSKYKQNPPFVFS